MQPFLPIMHTKKICCCVCISLVLTFCLAGQASAYESFTAALSFYQGLDVTTGMTEIDQTVLTLLFGDTEQAEIIVASDDNPFEFSPSVDFYFGFESGTMDSFLFIPEDNIVAMAVLQDLPICDFDDMLIDPFSASISSADIVLFKTADGRYFTISGFARLPGFMLNATVAEHEYEPTVPEPSTLLLVGLGLIGIMGIVRRKKKSAG